MIADEEKRKKRKPKIIAWNNFETMGPSFSWSTPSIYNGNCAITQVL